MKSPICVPCRKEMQCDENAVFINDSSTGTFPSTYWQADRFKCPECGHETIVGIAVRGAYANQLASIDIERSLEFTHH